MATVPSEMTMTAGHKVTAAEWNANVRDAINFLLNPPRGQAHQAVAQSIANTVSTTITLDTPDVNSDSMWSSGANTRLTVQTAGIYAVNGMVAYAGSTGGTQRVAAIYLNGSEVMQATAAPAGTKVGLAVGPIEITCNAGDYFTLVAYQDSGGALNTVVGPTGFSFLRAVRMSS